MPLGSHEKTSWTLLHTCVSHGWSSYSHGLIPRKFMTGFLEKITRSDKENLISCKTPFLEFHANCLGGVFQWWRMTSNINYRRWINCHVYFSIHFDSIYNIYISILPNFSSKLASLLPGDFNPPIISQAFWEGTSLAGQGSGSNTCCTKVLSLPYSLDV